VPAAGGPALSICDAPGLFPTASWGPNDVILFATFHDRQTRLRKVLVSTGAVTELTALGEGMRPEFLRDGRRFLYAGGTQKDWGLRLASIDAEGSKLLQPIGNFRFAYGSGHVFLNQNDVLTAQRFDEATGTLVGPAVTIAGLGGDPNTWFAVSAAADRVVAFARSDPKSGNAGDPMARLVWVNREGEQIGTLGEPGRYWTMALSPDDQRVAVSLGADLLVLDRAGGRTRMTYGTESWNPVWNADGTELLFSSSLTGLVRRRLEAAGTGTPLENVKGLASDWSHDGTRVLISVGSSAADIHLYDVAAKSMKPWLVTQADERGARVSPDDKWVAFTSDEGGQTPQGKELFFLGADGSMMAAGFTATGTTARPGRPRVLFLPTTCYPTASGFSSTCPIDPNHCCSCRVWPR
jgi:hypothetical protein